MTATLNTFQVELNCRRLYQYGIDSLEADEYGTLHLKNESKKDHTDYKLEQIPESSKRYKNITPALIATMEGMCLEMQKSIPICFFMIPKISTQFLMIHTVTFSIQSYDALVKKIEATATPVTDPKCAETIKKVKATYAGISYGFMLPNHEASVEEYRELNQYAMHMLFSNGTPNDFHAKHNFITEQNGKIRTGINWGFFDPRRQVTRPLKWVTSGEWRETQFTMPEETLQ